jgi:ubiquitin-like modifier-activating enzyme ATG7
MIGVVDPSASSTHPGWPLRNLLAYFRALFPSITSLRILCWRDSDPSSNNMWKSRFNVVFNTPPEGAAPPSAVGWEKNAQQKLGPRMADLAPMLDPER